MYDQSQKVTTCSNHPNAGSEIEMKECKVTVPNELEPKKELIEEYLMCPRCFKTIPITSELRFQLESLKQDNGTVKEKTTTTKSSTSFL